MPRIRAVKCPNGEQHAIPFDPPMSIGWFRRIRELMDLRDFAMLTWLTIRDQEGHTPETTAAAWRSLASPVSGSPATKEDGRG